MRKVMVDNMFISFTVNKSSFCFVEMKRKNRKKENKKQKKQKEKNNK